MKRLLDAILYLKCGAKIHPPTGATTVYNFVLVYFIKKMHQICDCNINFQELYNNPKFKKAKKCHHFGFKCKMDSNLVTGCYRVWILLHRLIKVPLSCLLILGFVLQRIRATCPLSNLQRVVAMLLQIMRIVDLLN